jgi:DNA polymerase I-like protein with 3'-5' exonuclease and polymerase domains
LPKAAHVVMQVHDEWQIECPPEMADEVGQHVVDCIKRAGGVLDFRCQLDGSYHIGENWNETH